ncbi:MAG TPA: acyl-CoA dehydrogenase, partial [Citreicella sp.]|nr:acyl-CoA dehydrogenase [Citreicella sp.]
MAHDGQDVMREPGLLLDDLLGLTGAALPVVEAVLDQARQSVRAMVEEEGRVSARLIDTHQTAAHGLAWLATYAEALRQMQGWAGRLQAQGSFGEVEALIHQIAFGEYLNQIAGGIQMNQGEVIRLADLGLGAGASAGLQSGAAATLAARGNTQAVRSRLVELMQERAAEITVGRCGLDDELEMIREQFRRYAVDRIEPHAHDWHLKDDYIPLEVIDELAEMGVFGLTIPENLGGLGLSKASMCVVSEELSRGYIGVGSLGTRSEIAAELILAGGTDAQKEKWLPLIASGQILPTAVFTEPNTGSDLGSLRTRAVRDQGDYLITGNKTWITHAARAHVMTLLARTDPASSDYKGLSMFLAEKEPGTDADPFPTPGMTGGEIEVLGYRGMKEF